MASSEHCKTQQQASKVGMELSPTSVVGYIVTIIIALVVFDLLRSWYRLRPVPGPFSAGFCKLWFLRHTLGGEVHLRLGEAAKKYGVAPLSASFLLQISKVVKIK